MNGKDDYWVAAALSDDSLVAELLSRLTESSSHPPHLFLRVPCVWGQRQRRSKGRKESGSMSVTRRSPTTPLSWSGGSDGEHSNSFSSRPPSDLSRSNKGEGASSCNKKKSFAERESSLLRERVVGLKGDLDSLYSGQRASEGLRRIEMHLRAEHDGRVALPDLNMMPSEEDMVS